MTTTQKKQPPISGVLFSAPLALALSLSALAIVGTSSVPAYAAELNEKIITAYQRDASLKEFAAFVSVYTAADLSPRGISDLQTLSTSIPNFSYSQATGANDVLIMRGLGTVGNGPHLEQSVGQVFNGFYRKRSRLGRLALMDVNQIEILRGPQDTYAGRNSSIGLINIAPNKPSNKFEFDISASHNFENSEGYATDIVISGPLSDNFLARVALNIQDKEGWIDNEANYTDAQEKQDATARLILNYSLANAFDIEFIYELAEYNRAGKPREITHCNATAAAAFRGGVSPREDCKLNTVNYSGVERSQGGDFPGAAPLESSSFSDESFDLKSDFYGITLSRNYGAYTFSFAHSNTDYEIFDRYDADLAPNRFALSDGDALGPANIGASELVDNTEEYKQTTYEIRFVSNDGRILDYTAGLHYLDSRLDFLQNYDHVGVEPVPTVRATSATAAQSDAPSLPPARLTERSRIQTESLAVFGEITYHVINSLDLTFSMRWTDEERSGIKNQEQAVYPGAPATGVGALCANANVAGAGAVARRLHQCFRGTPLQGSTDEDALAWTLGAKWFLQESQMLYVNFGTGYKSGGFNIGAQSNSAQSQATFIFDEEKSSNLELGGKHSFHNANLAFNWAIYNTNVEDLQLQSLNPVSLEAAVVGAEATTVGLEYQVVWQPTSDFSLGVTGAFNFSEYDEFLAPCYYNISGDNRGAQTVGNGCNIGVNGAILTADANATNGTLQDLTGETLPFAPEIMFTVDLDWVLATGVSGDWTLDLKAYYVDDYQLSVTNADDTVQLAYTKLDAGISWADRDSNWTVSLIGRNLSDRLVRNWSDIHTYGNDGASIYRSAAIDEPRTFAIRAEYSF